MFLDMGLCLVQMEVRTSADQALRLRLRFVWCAIRDLLLRVLQNRRKKKNNVEKRHIFMHVMM